MLKNIAPGKSQKLTKIEFSNFQRGTIQDPPASEINQAFADSSNITAFPRYWEGRTGCRPYGVPLENLANRTGYAAHKSGTNIVSDSGTIFSEQDVGQYFSFGTQSELITAYIDEETVVGSDAIYKETAYGGIVAMPNATLFHANHKKWMVLLGGELRVAEILMSSWVNALCISRKRPGTTRSDLTQYKDKAVAFTSNGIFKIEVSDFPLMYQVNLNPPDTKLTGIPFEEGFAASYRYLYSAAKMPMIGRQNGIEIDIETGTNLPDDTDIDYAEIYTENEISSTNPVLVQTLYLPKDSDGNYEHHLTHFVVWRTESLEATDIDDVNKERFNDPNRFVWVKDLPAGMAFLGSLTGNVFTAQRGTFSSAETHCMLELEDGQRFEILEVTSSTTAVLDTGDYGGGDIGLSAAAIGNGRVMRGSIANGTLTIIDGAVLTTDDEGKTLISSDGDILYVTERISANSGTIHSNVTLPEQGFTLDFTHRQFYDTVDDATLHARKDFYTCRSRYRRPLPNGNIGSLIPGFVVTASRGSSQIYYSHLESEYSQLLGQYIPNMQTIDDVKDSIQLFWVFEGILSAICSMSTFGVIVGISEFATLPSSTEAIALLPGFKIVDKNRGCLDIDSVCEVENGMIALITNEPGGEALRLFNGTSYSAEDYLYDAALGGRIVKKFQKTLRKSVAVYDGNIGLTLWRKNG